MDAAVSSAEHFLIEVLVPGRYQYSKSLGIHSVGGAISHAGHATDSGLIKPRWLLPVCSYGLFVLVAGTKATVLRPLQRRIHVKHGLSPEDQKATRSGGYTREELEALRMELGFRDVYYECVALFDYLLWRAHCKFNVRWLLTLWRPIRWLDRLLARTALMKSQGVALVFGFDAYATVGLGLRMRVQEERKV